MDGQANVTNNNDSYSVLMRANDARALTQIPAMAVFGLYIILGTFGNSLVFYIIGMRFKYSTQNFLIVCLAIFDLLTCIIPIPTEFVDLSYPYAFPSEAACKIIRTLKAVPVIGSTFTLLVIAIDRYRKICQPLKEQMRKRHAIIAVILIIFVTINYSWPAAVIYGFRSGDKLIGGLRVWDCSTADIWENTSYPFIYTAVLILTYIISSVVLVVLYCYILVITKRHYKAMRVKSNAYLSCHKCSSTDDTNLSVSTSPPSKDQGKVTQTVDETTPKVQTNDDQSVSKDDQNFVNATQTDKSITGGQNNFVNNRNILGKGDPDQPEAFELEISAENETGSSDVKRTTSDNDGGNFNVSFQMPILNNCKTNACTSMTTPNDRPPNYVSFDGEGQDNMNTSIESLPKLPAYHGNTASTKKEKVKPAKKTTTKTTLIAFLVTLVFILSFLPYLCLRIVENIGTDLHYSLEGVSLVFYNLTLRSYYINSFVNPFIYGALNIRFRIEVKGLLKKMFARR